MDRREFIVAGAALMLGCSESPAPSRRAATAHPPGTSPSGARDSGTRAFRAPALGINSHLLLEDDLRLVRDLGFTHVRSTLYTPRWTEDPTYIVAARENAARVVASGLRLLYVVHNARDEVFRMGNDPRAARRFAITVAEMVRAMPGVEAWQLWNEQDVWVQAPFGAGAIPRRRAARVGENYGRWWSESYPALKEINPAALFVTGAAADAPGDRWREFHRGFSQSGAAADAIGVHAYGPWDRVSDRLHEVRAVVGPDTPLWLTECGGIPGDAWTPAHQAEAWRTTIEGNEREALADRVYPYCLETDPNDPWYGIRDINGSDRPVLEWLRYRVR